MVGKWFLLSDNNLIIMQIIIRQKRGLFMHAKEYLSATALSKKTSITLEALESGETEKLIILKNNAPMAVLLSMEAYEALEEEVEDLRLATLALARLHTFKEKESLSHDAMMDKFGK